MIDINPNPSHHVTYQEMCALLREREPHVTKEELLAIAGNMCGKLIAMSGLEPMVAMDLLLKNIEEGNKQIMDLVDSTEGTA